MTALSRWFLLKDSASLCHNQPLYPLSSIHSICKKYKIMTFVFLNFMGTLYIFRNLLRIFLLHLNNKSSLLSLLPFYRRRCGGRRKLNNLSKIIEMVNGKLWVLSFGKKNKLKGENKWRKTMFVARTKIFFCMFI